MKKTKFALLPLAILFCLFACRKDYLVQKAENIEPPPEILLEIEVQGHVFDQNGAVSGATVWLGDDFTTTDADGNFLLKSIVASRRAVVKVEKNGYFQSFRDFVPEFQKVASVQVALHQKGTPHFVSPAKLTIFENGDTVEFHDNFYDEMGKTYPEATVFFRRIDPSLDDQTLPSNYLTDTLGVFQPLESFGTFQITIENSAGEPLFSTDYFQINFGIAPSKISAAPSFCELYFFSEENTDWQNGFSNAERPIGGQNYQGWVWQHTIWTAAR